MFNRLRSPSPSLMAGVLRPIFQPFCIDFWAGVSTIFVRLNNFCVEKFWFFWYLIMAKARGAKMSLEI